MVLSEENISPRWYTVALNSEQRWWLLNKLLTTYPPWCPYIIYCKEYVHNLMFLIRSSFKILTPFPPSWCSCSFLRIPSFTIQSIDATATFDATRTIGGETIIIWFQHFVFYLKTPCNLGSYCSSSASFYKPRINYLLCLKYCLIVLQY